MSLWPRPEKKHKKENLPLSHSRIERKEEKIDGNVSKVKDYILLNVNIPLFKNACIT
jgi:hypothetical protein